MKQDRKAHQRLRFLPVVKCGHSKTPLGVEVFSQKNIHGSVTCKRRGRIGEGNGTP